MQIFVKDLDGRTFTLDVSPNDTVLDVKLMYEEMTGSEPEERRLIFAGKHLEYYRTLADYDIWEGSTLHFVLRLRGD